MLFIKSIIIAIRTALCEGALLGFQIGGAIVVVVLFLAVILLCWTALMNWCKKQVNPDNKAYKKAPKEPKISNPVSDVMRTNRFFRN